MRSEVADRVLADEGITEPRRNQANVRLYDTAGGYLVREDVLVAGERATRVALARSPGILNAWLNYDLTCALKEAAGHEYAEQVGTDPERFAQSLLRPGA